MSNKKTMIRSGIAAALLVMMGVLAPVAAFAESAGGVSLSSTRIIFNCSKGSEGNITVSNSSNNQNFLVQSWISDANGQKSKDFVVTPPLFMMKPSSENKLRILYVGPSLPQDRESLFWLTNKSIPSIDKSKYAGKNVLQLAISARIKGFCRPDGLTPSPMEAARQLTFQWIGKDLKIANPSPYYISVVNLESGGNKFPTVMVPPKSSEMVSGQKGKNGNVDYQVMTDYGSASEVMHGKMQ
jgi:fimbrial chaperone protein